MHINPKKKKKLNHDNKTLPLDYMFDIQIRQMRLQCHTKQIEIQQTNQGKKNFFYIILFSFFNKLDSAAKCFFFKQTLFYIERESQFNLL